MLRFCGFYIKKELLCCEVILLKELYTNLPDILKKQIALHTGIAIIALFLFLLTVVLADDLILALPCMLFAIFMIVKGAILFYNCTIGNCLEIKGICYDVEKTGFRKKIKALTVKSENKLLKIPMHYRLKNVSIGDSITVYMSKKTQLYYKNGSYITGDFYAVSVEKEE